MRMRIIIKINKILRHLANLQYNLGMETKENKTTKKRITKDSVFAELCKLDSDFADTDLKRVRISTMQKLVTKLRGS